jgi:predicted MPP superfamily phosphohydrolase
MQERKMTRRQFLKLIMAGGLSMASGAGYAYRVEPQWIDIEAVRVTLPRLPPAFHGYRMVQLSDLHMGDWMNRARLTEVVTLVNAQQPDLIAITGDFVTGRASRAAQDLIAVLSTLRARDGVVGVLGNHDHWGNAAVVRQVLRESRIIDLGNRVHTLERGSAQLHLAGVDDVWAGQQRLDLVLDQLPVGGGALLLAHEPDFADTTAATGRFDLQISGHSHGGQVVIPFLGAPHLPPLAHRYPSGRYQVGSLIQYTNRGVGMVPPHVRLNCRPEITVFTLESARA